MVQLQHFGKTLLVLATGPLGLIGAATALLVFQAPFGFVAILGVIALAGIIMRNSVILVDQIEQDMAAGHDALHGRWSESAVRRFRPITLTAAAAVLALIPLAERGVLGADGAGHDGRAGRGNDPDADVPAGALCPRLQGRRAGPSRDEVRP